MSSSITAEDSTYIWSPRPKHTHTHTHYVSFHGVFSYLLIARTRLSIANNHLRNSGLRVEDTEAYWVSHSLIHCPSPTRVGERQKAANDRLTSGSSTLVIRYCVFVRLGGACLRTSTTGYRLHVTHGFLERQHRAPRCHDHKQFIIRQVQNRIEGSRPSS